MALRRGRNPSGSHTSLVVDSPARTPRPPEPLPHQSNGSPHRGVRRKRCHPRVWKLGLRFVTVLRPVVLTGGHFWTDLVLPLRPPTLSPPPPSYGPVGCERNVGRRLPPPDLPSHRGTVLGPGTVDEVVVRLTCRLSHLNPSVRFLGGDGVHCPSAGCDGIRVGIGDQAPEPAPGPSSRHAPVAENVRAVFRARGSQGALLTPGPSSSVCRGSLARPSTPSAPTSACPSRARYGPTAVRTQSLTGRRG